MLVDNELANLGIDYAVDVAADDTC